jgi:ATP-dependent helicase/nuclease subunit B
VLKIHSLTGPADKAELIKAFDCKSQTWIVSDLKSKLQLQSIFLQNEGVLLDHSVMRASDYWAGLGRDYLPEWRVVSADFLRASYQSEFAAASEPWMRGPQAAKTLLQMMPQFLPLYVQLPNEDLVRDWLREHPQSMIRWAHWFELGARFWQTLREKKLTQSAWLPALLLDFDIAIKSWRRPLVVDLSAQLTSLERELFKRISVDIDVDMLVPRPKWGGAFARALRVYEDTTPVKGEPAEISMSELRVPGRVERRRFTTALAEIKDAVATVRRWLEAGVDANQIALLAPDIEAYWPVLAPILAQEGINVTKGRTARAQCYPMVQLWLARLRLKLGRIERGDLELASFQGSEPLLPFAKFRRQFTHIFSLEQIFEEKILRENFSQEFNADDVIGGREFLLQCASRWPGAETELLETILKNLFEELPLQVRLPTRLWLDWLEASIGHPRLELSIQSPATSGIYCAPVMSAEWLPVSHAYFLGLSEEAFASGQPVTITAPELSGLERDLGVQLPALESGALEFETRWLLESPRSEIVLSCAKIDMAGGPLTPSRLWLLQSEGQIPEPQSPLVNRWDEIQRLLPIEIAGLRQWPMAEREIRLQSVAQDLGFTTPSPFKIKGELSLSPSSLESYAECPFIFAAGRVFKLTDEPELDLDLDYMTRGRLLHALFEKLTIEPRRWNWTNQDLEEILDTLRSELDIFDRGLWSHIKTRHLEIARQFLAAEKSWRDRFPSTRTFAREVAFKAFWSIQKGAMVEAPIVGEPAVRLSGRIDRVDGNEIGEYVVLDYKTSSANLRGLDYATRSDDFQLALYTQAVESGRTDLKPGVARAAQYYIAKDMTRAKGFQLKGENDLMPADTKGRHLIELERREEIFTALNQRIGALAGQIIEGQFTPQPKSQKDCADCQWRTLCRAPHLN